jgi:hypothetical protein
MRDLTDPAAGPHAVQALLDAAVGALAGRWGCAVDVRRSSPLVAVEDNYDRLGYAPAAATRAGRHSRYVSGTVMLRSHTSAGVPPALRALAARPDPPADVLLVLPGGDRLSEMLFHLASASKDEHLDGVDQCGGAVWAAADLAEDLPALEHRVRPLTRAALRGVSGVHLPLVARQPPPAGVGVAVAPLLRQPETGAGAAIAVVGHDLHPSLGEGVDDAVLARGAHVVSGAG